MFVLKRNHILRIKSYSSQHHFTDEKRKTNKPTIPNWNSKSSAHFAKNHECMKLFQVAYFLEKPHTKSSPINAAGTCVEV